MFYIFDWDGTISDSTEKITFCMQHAARDNGLPMRSGADIRNIIGLGLPEAIRSLYLGIDDARLEGVCDAYAEHFTEQDQSPSSFFPGVMATLTHLKEQGSTLAIATGKSRAGLNRVLETLGLQDFFHGSRCADETASKPHPQMLRELLDEFNVPLDGAVMVGDTEWDMAMAQHIGMPRIAVTYGAHPRARLECFAPNLVVDHFEDILHWSV